MARKGKSTEEIIQALREAEVRLGQGETVGKICRGFGISEQTYYKWRREYGGVQPPQSVPLILGFSSIVSGTGGRIPSA